MQLEKSETGQRLTLSEGEYEELLEALRHASRHSPEDEFTEGECCRVTVRINWC